MDDDGAQRMRMAAHHAALTAAFFQQASAAGPHGSWPVDPWPVLASMAAAARLGGGSAVPMQPAATYAAALSQLPRSVPYPSGSWSASPATGNPHVLSPHMWQAIFGGWTSPGLHPNSVLSMGSQPPVCSAAAVQPPSYFNVVSGQPGVTEGEDLRTCLRPLRRQETVAVGASTNAILATADGGAESASVTNTIGMPLDQAAPVGSCRHTFRTGSLHAFSPYSRSSASSQNASSAPSDTCLDLSVPRASDSFTEHRPSPVAATASNMAPAPSVLCEAAQSQAVMTSGSAGCGIRTASAKSEREGCRKAPIPVGIAVAWQRRQEPVDSLNRATASIVSKGDLEGQPLVPAACAGQRLPEPVDSCVTMPIRSQLCLENSLSPGKAESHHKSLPACAVKYEDSQFKVKDAAGAMTQSATTEIALQSESDDHVSYKAVIAPQDMAQAAIDLRRKLLAEGDPDDPYQYSSGDSLSEDGHSTVDGEGDSDENNDGTIGVRFVSEETTTVATAPDVPTLSVVQAVATSTTGEFERKRKEKRSSKSKKKKKKRKHSSKEKRKERERRPKNRPRLGCSPGKERTIETCTAVSLQLGSSSFPLGDREQSNVSPMEQLPVDDQAAGTMPADSGRLTESNENDSVHVRYGQVSYDLTDERSLLALCKSFSERKLALEEAKVHYKEQQLRLSLELAQLETGQQAAANRSEKGGAAASSSGVSARSSASSRSDLHLSVEDLTEGARLLIFIRGLPHEGTVVCLEPPSVYGVVLASQRSARPRVYAREDLLRDALRDVQPTRAEDLRHGSRVCAYWSSQFDCLYPGVVVKVLRPDNSAMQAAGSSLGQATRSKLSRSKTRGGRVLVEITFDDSDSGTFALEQIRMLPTGFPHTPTQFEFVNGDDDVLSVVPAERRLRSSSGSTASAAAAASVAPSSGLSPVSVTGPQSRCHPRSCRKRQAAESATDASRGFSESDDEPLNMLSKHAGVPTTSSSGSANEWVWSGSPTRTHVTAGSHGRRRSDKVFYSAVRRGNELLKVGDCAVFARREENMPPFVGTILSLWQGRRRMTVRVQWFYHPEEIADDSVRRGNQSLIGALFESEHEDEVNVQSILHRCEVLPMAIYRERRLHRRSPADVTQHTVFCIVGSYDAVGGRVTNVLDLTAVATDGVTTLNTASKQVHN